MVAIAWEYVMLSDLEKPLVNSLIISLKKVRWLSCEFKWNFGCEFDEIYTQVLEVIAFVLWAKSYKIIRVFIPGGPFFVVGVDMATYKINIIP